jgi:hypothetical protein
MLGSIVLAIMLNYWIGIVLLPLLLLLVYIRNYFLATSTEIKRIDGISIFHSFINSKIVQVKSNYFYS